MNIFEKEATTLSTLSTVKYNFIKFKLYTAFLYYMLAYIIDHDTSST